MAQPSPRAHLIRLAFLLFAGVVALLLARNALVPPTWSQSESYRKAALEELAQRPSVHGGNQSCIDCHQDEKNTHRTAMNDLLDGVHKSLSCESCHGPLAHHVAGDRKIADALIDYSRISCLNCHGNLISLPADFPKFILSDEPLPPNRETELLEAAQRADSKKFYRHKKSVHAGVNCTECHVSFHDPEP